MRTSWNMRVAAPEAGTNFEQRQLTPGLVLGDSAIAELRFLCLGEERHSEILAQRRGVYFISAGSSYRMILRNTAVAGVSESG